MKSDILRNHYLIIMLLWTPACVYLYEIVFLFSSGNEIPGVKLLDHMVVLLLVFRGHSIQFSRVAAAAAAAAAKLLQSCPTLCEPIDGSPLGSPVPGILQARTLQWVAISFSNGWKWKVKGKSLSRVRFSATPWTAAHQPPPSMGFSRQDYWSGVSSPIIG